MVKMRIRGVTNSDVHEMGKPEAGICLRLSLAVDSCTLFLPLKALVSETGCKVGATITFMNYL